MHAISHLTVRFTFTEEQIQKGYEDGLGTIHCCFPAIIFLGIPINNIVRPFIAWGSEGSNIKYMFNADKTLICSLHKFGIFGSQRISNSLQFSKLA